MDRMDIHPYICAELVVLVPVLYLLGAGLKKSRVPDKRIPMILGLAGVVLSAIWVFSSRNIGSMQDILAAAFAAITQGILTAGASVYANQIYKQFGKEEKNDENTESVCDTQ